ncbi:4-hydroxybenzoate polyprenyltransferase [Kitasatospora sp. MAP12-15]|uniref:hypothetical protein n=1 Tax=unclassified Kitasatospora TaxID=2633591 RepID=UPI0024755DDC|nr:hypothetical protein [Kitasatospora sp. MAP12-44]MDH6108795.1 4-hydroxybenzoate polyprenyltransferase [Kitasatospora sp. MAP12-44]
MIRRLGRYVRGSWPPAFYLPYALLWALGLSALFARADHRIGSWRPGPATVPAVAAFVLALLLMRAVDDLRDLRYDRVHNPRRPLPSGAVAVADLGVLLGAGSAVALLLALAVGPGAATVLAAVLLYAALLLALELLWRWPAPQRVTLSALLGLPVQLLLNCYLYAAVLARAGLRPDGQLLAPLLTAVAAFLHLEFARKTTRSPQPGEHSYSTRYGAQGTAVRSVAAAGAAVLLALAVLRPWAGHGWGWLVLLPAGAVLFGARRFWPGRAVRWPAGAAALFLLGDFAVFLLLGLLGKAA